MTSKVKLGWLDYSAETSKTSFNIPTVTAANFDASVALVGAAAAVAVACSDCTYTGGDLELIQDAANDGVPSDEFAQRELCFSIQYMDTTTGRKETSRIPGPVGDLIPKGTDKLPLANAAFAALIAVLQANIVSKDGNTVQVTRGVFNGRNN